MGAGEESRHGEVAWLLVHRDSLCLFDPGCEMKMHLFHLCKAVLFPYSSKPSLFVGQQFTGVESQCLETITSNSSTGRGDRFPLQGLSSCQSQESPALSSQQCVLTSAQGQAGSVPHKDGVEFYVWFRPPWTQWIGCCHSGSFSPLLRSYLATILTCWVTHTLWACSSDHLS